MGWEGMGMLKAIPVHLYLSCRTLTANYLAIESLSGEVAKIERIRI